MWKSVKNWLQEWVFNIYKWKLGRSRWIAYFKNYLQKWFGDRYEEFPTAFTTRISCKIFPQQFPARFSHKIFPSWILIGWLPITLFQMLNFHQSLPFLNWLFPSSISCKIFPQDFPARISRKIFPQEFPTRFSHKNFPQYFPTRFSRNNFPQDFPELDPHWLAPHHPIPNAKFPPITAFLKLAFSPPPFPTRISHKIFPQEFPTVFSCNNFPQQFPTTISRKIFLQQFPARFSHKIFLQEFHARFSRARSWLVGYQPNPINWQIQWGILQRPWII